MRARTAVGVGMVVLAAVAATLSACAGDGDPPPPAPPVADASVVEATREPQAREVPGAETVAGPVAAEDAPPATPPTVVRPPDVQIVRLTDPDGRPLAGAYVDVQGEKLPVRWASADANGVVSFAGLPDAPLVVRVRPKPKALDAVRVLRRPGELTLAWRRLEVSVEFPKGGGAASLNWWPRRVGGRSLFQWHETVEPWRADVPPDPGWVTAERTHDDEWAPLRVGPVEPGGPPVVLALERGVRIEGRIVGTAGSGRKDARWRVVLVNEHPDSSPPDLKFECGEDLESPLVARGSTWTLVLLPSGEEREFAVIPGVVAPTTGLTVTAAPGRRTSVRVELPPNTAPEPAVVVHCWPARSNVLAGATRTLGSLTAAEPAVFHSPNETLAIAAGDDGLPFHTAAPVLAAPADAEVVLRLTPAPLLGVRLRFADGTPVTFGRLRVEPLATGQPRYGLKHSDAETGGPVVVRLRGFGSGVVAAPDEDGRFTAHVLPGRRRLTWTWFNDVEIDLGEVDVPAEGDVVLTLPTADR